MQVPSVGRAQRSAVCTGDNDFLRLDVVPA